MHRGAVRTLVAALAAAFLIAPASAQAAFTVQNASAPEGEPLEFEVQRGLTDSGDCVPQEGPEPRATAGVDFDPAPDSSCVGTVEVPTIEDTIDEPDENVRLVAPGGASGIGTITDDDPAPALSISDTTVRENEPAKLTITAPNPSSRAIVIPLSTNGGADVGVPQNVTLPAGQTTVDVPLTIADTEDEPDETFTVTLGDASGATIADRDGSVTIVNDDLRVVSVLDASTPEGDSGNANAQFLIRLNGPTFRPVTVRFATADGDATAPADYLARLGTATVAPGSTVAAIDVPVVGDDEVEPTEVFGLALTDVANATLGDASAVGVILDDGDTAAASGDVTPPKMTIGKPTAKGSQVRVKVACPRAERSCSGRVSLYTTKDSRVGAETFRLSGGRSTTLTITVPSSILRKARRKGKLKLLAFAVSRDADENYDTRTRRATLRYKRKG